MWLKKDKIAHSHSYCRPESLLVSILTKIYVGATETTDVLKKKKQEKKQKNTRLMGRLMQCRQQVRSSLSLSLSLVRLRDGINDPQIKGGFPLTV